MLSSFSHTYCPCPCVCLLWKNVYSIPLTIWSWIFFFFFCYWVLWVLCILWILTPYHINDSKIFKWFQFHSSLFHLLMFFLLDAFKFNVSHLFISLLFLCFLVSSQKKKKKSLPGLNVKELTLLCFLVGVLLFQLYGFKLIFLYRV